MNNKHWRTEGFNPLIDTHRDKAKSKVTYNRYRKFTKEEIDTIVGLMFTKTVSEIWHTVRPVGISQRTFTNRVHWMRKHPKKNFYKKVCSK